MTDEEIAAMLPSGSVEGEAEALADMLGDEDMVQEAPSAECLARSLKLAANSRKDAFIPGFLMDDAAEMMALAACSIQESVAQLADALADDAAGRKPQTRQPNEFANLLADMLRCRETLPAKGGSRG